MQVTNTQTTTTNHPTGQATGGAEFGAAMTAGAGARAALNPHQEALLNAALDNIAHQMEAHGHATLAPFARQTLENAARPVLADPNLPDEENLNIIGGHFLHNFVNRMTGFDPAAPMHGPITIPQRDGSGALNMVAFDFPEQHDLLHEIENFHIETARRETSEPNLVEHSFTGRSNRAELSTEIQIITGQFSGQYGPNLSERGRASSTLNAHLEDDRREPHDHSAQNARIAAGYIPHLMLVDNGAIQDDRFPQGGPYWIPYHLPTGELIQKPVELA
ncbi:hypothetical protein [Saliniramus sp.]|uniref:hypothetical protein n=1 Tax=Saliniramus sp. TaxID=2986772 RepID=UPI002BF70624|nr:hypothetical protein [Saliniramus sp.]HMB11903.1 hypothetical protein [Saliniramus sp.]